MDPICYFNRYTGRVETETVYGEAALRFTYGHPLGRLALAAFIRRPVFSAWYGRKMDRPESRARIAPFIGRYGLDSGEFADPPESFGSFNEFFFRKLKPEVRPVDPAEDAVVFPADGRHLGFERARRYADGALVLSRLCPVDYHRFHFPVAGLPGDVKLLNGPLYSVSPLALRRRLAYLWTNKRTLTTLQTRDFGTVLLLEIGATCVGTIRQTFSANEPVAKGAEKGYFAFGGSSTITIFEPGRLKLAADLLEQSARQTELYARMGDRMGVLAG
ncbi:MAG: phosphatidylserine decarboxylase [Akkermansiaceae bacterium]|nr:phosphatidylserine decarboxylase [Akkermansiaceae bacterium]